MPKEPKVRSIWVVEQNSTTRLHETLLSASTDVAVSYRTLLRHKKRYGKYEKGGVRIYRKLLHKRGNREEI